MTKDRDSKTPWQEPALVEIGHVADIVQGGEGKLTPVGSDPGESKKIQPDEIPG